MKILLTGRDGQVGSELLQRLGTLGELVATGRAMLDFADPDAVRRVVQEVRPQLIVNAAAYTAVDKAESEPEFAMRINGVAPGLLAEEARRCGALVVHYSTDYVFAGDKACAYVEEDTCQPLNVYGRTKLEGELRIRASGCRHLILRTSWVYAAAHGRNFFRTIAGKLRAGERLRVVADQRGVPTSAAFLADETLALLARDAAGVFHLVPSGSTTWHGFAQAIAGELGVRASIDAIQSGEFPAPARRPPNSVLDNHKASSCLGRALADWAHVLALEVARAA